MFGGMQYTKNSVILKTEKGEDRAKWSRVFVLLNLLLLLSRFSRVRLCVTS